MALRGDRLRDIRQQRGYTQEELASLIDVGLRMIPRYESGTADPSSDVVTRMAKTLAVTTDYLLGLTDDPTGQFEEDELSPMERKLIAAFRRGEIVEAFAIAAELAKAQE